MLNSKHLFSSPIPNFILVLVLFSILGCGVQVNPKETSQTSEILKTSEPKNSLILNQYKDNKKEGLWQDFHQNGQLKSEGNYIEGLKEGLHKEWGNNGILLLEGFYSKDKANGLMKWYHEKGHLAGEGNMIDDIRIGSWKICDIQENGFCIDANFKNGKRDGVWKIYHEHAKDKLWKEETYKDDKFVSEKCWDENSNPIECK